MDGTPGIDGENGTGGANGFPGEEVCLLHVVYNMLYVCMKLKA